MDGNTYLPVLAVECLMPIGHVTGDDPAFKALIEFADAASVGKSDHYNDASDENIVRRALLQIVPHDNWYASNIIHRSVIEFAKAQGIEMEQALTSKRVGTLRTNMGLYSNKVRRTIEGIMIRMYYVETTTLERIAESMRSVGETDRPFLTLGLRGHDAQDGEH